MFSASNVICVASFNPATRRPIVSKYDAVKHAFVETQQAPGGIDLHTCVFHSGTVGSETRPYTKSPAKFAIWYYVHATSLPSPEEVADGESRPEAAKAHIECMDTCWYESHQRLANSVEVSARAASFLRDINSPNSAVEFTFNTHETFMKVMSEVAWLEDKILGEIRKNKRILSHGVMPYHEPFIKNAESVVTAVKREYDNALASYKRQLKRYSNEGRTPPGFDSFPDPEAAFIKSKMADFELKLERANQHLDNVRNKYKIPDDALERIEKRIFTLQQQLDEKKSQLKLDAVAPFYDLTMLLTEIRIVLNVLETISFYVTRETNLPSRQAARDQLCILRADIRALLLPYDDIFSEDDKKQIPNRIELRNQQILRFEKSMEEMQAKMRAINAADRPEQYYDMSDVPGYRTDNADWRSSHRGSDYESRYDRSRNGRRY